MVTIKNRFLEKTNYYTEKTPKDKIVIGNSYSSDLSHIDRWLNTYNGKYKRTAHFTIDLNGDIYQHIDLDYWSNFVNCKYDKNIISIVLVNEGWLAFDSVNNQYYDFLNNKYNRKLKPIIIPWRNFKYWSPYENKQNLSLINLCLYLFNEYNINLNVVEDNLIIKNIGDYKGILTRANINKGYTDLTPAFNFTKFKNNLDKKFIKDERND